MKLFSFLKGFPSKKLPVSRVDPGEFIPTFWEDDYCQVEMVPAENEAFIKQQAAAITDHAHPSKDGLGFTASFERGPMEYPTLSMEIRADYFETTLSGWGLPKATHIRYGANTLIDATSSKTKAFGFSHFVLFFDVADDFIQNIWLSIGPITAATQLAPIQSILYQLGESHAFILIDWNSQELVDLRDSQQICNYLRGFRKE